MTPGSKAAMLVPPRSEKHVLCPSALMIVEFKSYQDKLSAHKVINNLAYFGAAAEVRWVHNGMFLFSH